MPITTEITQLTTTAQAAIPPNISLTPPFSTTHVRAPIGGAIKKPLIEYNNARFILTCNAPKQRHILRFERSEAKYVRWLGLLEPLSVHYRPVIWHQLSQALEQQLILRGAYRHQHIPTPVGQPLLADTARCENQIFRVLIFPTNAD